MAEQYRTEHVATTPHGWHVRTVARGTHMVRVAFPPGRRKKGAGKLIQVLHPVNENPCAVQMQNLYRSQLPESATKQDWISTVAARMKEDYESKRRQGKSHNEAMQETIDQSSAGSASVAVFKRLVAGSNPSKSERQRATRERAKRIRSARLNPDADLDRAADLYEQFHGRSPKEVIEMQESDEARRTYVGLGDLVRLEIETPAGETREIVFSGDGVKVACSPNGLQLYLIGGNQNIDSALEQFGSDPGKDFVELGRSVLIEYGARKAIDGYKAVQYWHIQGEETNEPPIAMYDRLKHRIFFVGGRYRVEAPGIIN